MQLAVLENEKKDKLANLPQENRDRITEYQGWKFMSCCQSQELVSMSVLASDWLFALVQPIRSQLA